VHKHIRGLLRVRLAVHLKALACNVKRMVKYLVERGRKAAKAAASSLRVILTWIGAGTAGLTGGRPIQRPGRGIPGWQPRRDRGRRQPPPPPETGGFLREDQACPNTATIAEGPAGGCTTVAAEAGRI
jgi:hypothetical protein